MSADFLWCVCTLETREEMLQLYLNINAGGTPHSPEELKFSVCSTRNAFDEEGMKTFGQARSSGRSGV